MFVYPILNSLLILYLAIFSGAYITYAPFGGKSVPTQLANAPLKSIATDPSIIPDFNPLIDLASIIVAFSFFMMD